MITISDDSCRICLSLCHENETQIDQFSSLLQKCTGVEINPHDIPKKICPECLINLLQAYQFIRTVENTEEILSDLRNVVDVASEIEIEEESSVKLEPLDEDLEKQHFPTEAKLIVKEDEDFTAEYLEEGEVFFENPGEAIIETVVKWEESEDRESPAPEEAPTQDTIPPIVATTSQPKTNSQMVRCSFCSVEIRSTSLRRHIKNFHYGVRYQCDHCSRSYTIKENLQLHIKKQHLGQSNTYQCSYCEKTYNNWSGRYYHETKEHKQNFRHICEFCNKPFLHKGQLADHVSLHHTKVPHRKCSDCHEEFFTIDTWTWHKKSCHGDHQWFECKFCEKSYRRKTHLIRHEKTHMETN